MRLKAGALLTGLGMFLYSAVASAAGTAALWSDVNESQIVSRGATSVEAGIGRTLRLDFAAMRDVLSFAPRERDVFAPDSSFELELPMPDGDFQRFRVVESPVMEPALAKRYPSIRTYLGQGIDNPTATVRFDTTSRGLRAQVIAATHTTYIEPYQKGDTSNYVVFNKSDNRRSNNSFTCGVTGETVKSVPNLLRRNDVSKIASGGNLRTYRLALSATGEYTAALGGTVADALSGMVTTINRVNGIYERELAVRMVLIGETDRLIYTDGATDPFTNLDGGAMLNENQSLVDQVIGQANYDIGHVFSTGGGGIALLGSVCENGYKAGGVTGSPDPKGDSYDVDYVAHEMGHQFGGNHTFNGAGGACAGGNRNASTAYEPGSGVTIQAYAGICSNTTGPGDNTQPNSEDYFHRVSLNEMLGFTTNVSTGGSCGVGTTTGNNAPTVTTPAAFTIPMSTPFTLTASGTDPDGDAITYIWEQFTLGTRNNEGVLVDANGAVFRNFAPTTSPSRTFPSLRYILNNANVPPATAPIEGTTSVDWFTAERLASSNRTMNFRVTVRDNRAGGGGTNEASTTVTVTNSAGPFVVTAPNTAGISWAAGSSQTVTWNVANTTNATVNAATVDIALSRDGGQSFPIVLASGVANNGTASVTIPAGTEATTQARIKVSAVGNIFFDINNFDFAITGTNTAPSLNVTGTVSTRQGSPAATAVVANVSDVQDAAAALQLTLSQVPPELSVSVSSNAAGAVSLTATAACSLVAPTSGEKAYPVLLTATDLNGASTSRLVSVMVGGNQMPTGGTYGNLFLARGNATTNAISAPFADPNNNLAGLAVSPALLPGSGAGATLSIAANGTVTINTDANTALGTHKVTATATDSCGAVRERTFNVTVTGPAPVLSTSTISVAGNNNRLDQNDCNAMTVRLVNNGGSAATVVSAVLSSSTPGVTVAQANSGYPTLNANGGFADNSTPFSVSTAAGVPLGTLAQFTLTVTFAETGAPLQLNFTRQIGFATGNYTFTSGTGATIPAGGTFIGLSDDDDGLVNIITPADFHFSIYGREVPGGSIIRASTNGILQVSTVGGSRGYTNGALPNTATSDAADYPEDALPPSDPVLFPYWHDLSAVPTGGGIFVNTVGTAPNREFIVEWRVGAYNGSTAPSSVTTNFAVVFKENSAAFEYRYVTTGTGSSANGASATVGIQSSTSAANPFTQFSLNSNVITPGRVLTATPSGTSGPGVCVSNNPPLLNIDDSSAPDVYSAATDGVLLLRYLLGVRGAALVANATGTNPQRNAAQIEAHIAANLAAFDVDGDLSTLATTDGLLIVRRLLGLSGPALTNGARNGARSDTDVANAIDALKP